MSQSGASREIERLATLERRGGDEQLRVSVDEYSPAQGAPTRYVSVRLWFRDADNDWRPTRRGITIRGSEVSDVGQALRRAAPNLQK